MVLLSFRLPLPCWLPCLRTILYIPLNSSRLVSLLLAGFLACALLCTLLNGLRLVSLLLPCYLSPVHPSKNFLWPPSGGACGILSPASFCLLLTYFLLLVYGRPTQLCFVVLLPLLVVAPLFFFFFLLAHAVPIVMLSPLMSSTLALTIWWRPLPPLMALSGSRASTDTLKQTWNLFCWASIFRSRAGSTTNTCGVLHVPRCRACTARRGIKVTVGAPRRPAPKLRSCANLCCCPKALWREGLQVGRGEGQGCCPLQVTPS